MVDIKRLVLGDHLVDLEEADNDPLTNLHDLAAEERFGAVLAERPHRPAPKTIPRPQHRWGRLDVPDLAKIIEETRHGRHEVADPYRSSWWEQFRVRRQRRRISRQAKDLAKAGQRTSRPPLYGPRTRNGGRAPWFPGRAGTRDLIFTGTTNQVAGLFPFVVGGGAPMRGVPLGVHALTHEPVHWSPLDWLQARLVTNPTAFIVAQPGVGKSAFIKRMVAVSAGAGVLPIILGDLKPDYPPLVRALGGQVVSLGPGKDKINPLDAGPIAAAAQRMTDAGKHEAAEVLWHQANDRRLALVLGLCGLGRSEPLRAEETVILSAALDEMTSQGHVAPTLGELVEHLKAPSEELIKDCYLDDATFEQASRPLIHTLMMMLKGPLKGVFDGPTSQQLDLSAPAIELDISSIDGDTARPAAMLAVWAYSLAIIEAEIALAEEGLAEPRNYLAVLDEFWQALRGAPGLVDRADRITRINRQLRLGVLMSTHSMDDLRALPTEEDQAKARGIIDRSATVIVGASSPAELDTLAAHIPGGLNEQERNLILSWSSSATYDVDNSHPGQGRFLIKTGEQRAGLPVQVILTQDELELYETTRLAQRTPTNQGSGGA